MQTFEEKILGYLDGSLGEADREAVVAGIAAKDSPERALFDAHLRLEELYTLVQKPTSAPLALQRELASKLPVLAIKLPYLAAPVDRRDRVTAGWFGSTRSSWVNVFLLGAVLLLIGGIWYGISRSGNTIESAGTRGNDLTGSSAHNNSAPSNGSSTPFANSGRHNSSDNSSGTVATKNNYSKANSNGLHANRTNSTPRFGRIANNTLNTLHASGLNHTSSAVARNISNLPHTHGRTVNNGAQAHSSSSNANPVTPGNDYNSSQTNVLDISNQTKPIPSVPGSNSTNANPAPELPPLSISAVTTIPAQPISYQHEKDILLPFPIEEQSSSYLPLRAFVSGQYRTITFQNSPSEYVRKNSTGIISASATAPGLLFGVEYEVSPWISVGIHGGQAGVIQQQQFVHTQVNAYYYSNTYQDAFDTLRSGNWIGPSIAGTVNPQDKLQYSLSLSGGPLLSSVKGWIGMVDGGVSYPLSTAIALRGDVSFDVSRINPSTANSSSLNSSTTGYITTAIAAPVQSTAVGFSRYFVSSLICAGVM